MKSIKLNNPEMDVFIKSRGVLFRVVAICNRVSEANTILGNFKDVSIIAEDAGGLIYISENAGSVADPDLLGALETLINLRDGVSDGGNGITEADWRAARSEVKLRANKTSSLLAAIKSAQRHFEHGDPIEAVSCIDLALRQKLAPDVRKLLEKAHEEGSIGSTEKAEHFLDVAVTALEEM